LVYGVGGEGKSSKRLIGIEALNSLDGVVIQVEMLDINVLPSIFNFVYGIARVINPLKISRWPIHKVITLTQNQKSSSTDC